MDTPSSNVAYTTAEAVLTSFRSRLDPDQVFCFADALPAVIRALFLQGYRLSDAQPWADAKDYQAEALGLRQDHNFAKENAVQAVSFALHRALGGSTLERELDRIGPKARAFWRIDGHDAKDLEFRFR